MQQMDDETESTDRPTIKEDAQTVFIGACVAMSFVFAVLFDPTIPECKSAYRLAYFSGLALFWLFRRTGKTARGKKVFWLLFLLWPMLSFFLVAPILTAIFG